MTTTLEKSLKRELVIEGQPHTLVISPEGLHLAPKGRRKGVQLRWIDLVSGEAALAVALNASLANVQRFPTRAGGVSTNPPTATATRIEPPRHPVKQASKSLPSKKRPAARKQ